MGKIQDSLFFLFGRNPGFFRAVYGIILNAYHIKFYRENMTVSFWVSFVGVYGYTYYLWPDVDFPVMAQSVPI